MSKDRVVYKQWYKSRREPSVRKLNRLHLIYAATRPGVVCNPGFGFGLWGKIEGMKTIGDINDLTGALQAVGAASNNHTVYRAMLSVDQATAQEFDLYERVAWERLLRSRMAVIQDGMHIKKEDFNWVATMHYKKTHPHVHILFWDAGLEPKQEWVEHARFEEMAENVRHAFTGAIVNQQEITEVNNLSKEALRETRRELAAMFKEANLADALNLDHVKPAQCTELGKQLIELAATIPGKGALKYDYLPSAYKEKLNSYLEDVLKVSDFAKLERKYAELKEQVSQLYGNTPNLAAEYRENAHRAFIKELGNETLKYLKSVAAELKEQTPPEDIETLLRVTKREAGLILKESREYAELLASLPNFRTPLQELLKHEDIKERMDTLTRRLAQDLRIRAKANALIDKEKDTQDLTKEEAAQTRKDIYKDLYRAMHSVLWSSIQEDKGYAAQAKASLAASALLRLFRSTSQSKNQMQNRKDMLMEKYRNLSETAKKDLRKRREQEGNWSLEV